MNLSYYLTGAGLLGSLVGSFLNVIIYRLPLMLTQAWDRECSLRSDSLAAAASPPPPTLFNLITPRSHCPRCQKPVPVWANIPLLSYLALKGKCLFCKNTISLRYPLIEFITATISILVVRHFGLHWQSVSALVLSWGLITLAAIDFNQQLLPDIITFPLLWLGLLLSLCELHVNTQDAIIGVIAGYLSLWTVAKLFKILRKKDGMGEGDYKLLAALGAWLGWQGLPAVIFMASVFGLVSHLGLILNKPYKDYRYHCIPFGPYLSLAGWIMLLWPPSP